MPTEPLIDAGLMKQVVTAGELLSYLPKLEILTQKRSFESVCIEICWEKQDQGRQEEYKPNLKANGTANSVPRRIDQVLPCYPGLQDLLIGVFRFFDMFYRDTS